MKGFMLSIFAFFAVFATVYGLKCYNCVGTEKTCSKDYLSEDSSKEMTCPNGMDKCMRTWAKSGDTTAIVNSCSNEATCTTLKDQCDKNSDGDCAVGCCDSDLCNAGSPVSFSVFLMTVCSALGLVLLK